MSNAPMITNDLCALYCLATENEKESVCIISQTKATAVALLCISISFIVTGIYLLLTGINTIPAFAMGCALLVAGSSALFISGFLFLNVYSTP